MNEREYIRSRFMLMNSDNSICDELTQLASIRLLKYKNYNEYQFKKLIGLICKSVYIDYLRKKKPEEVYISTEVSNIEDEIIKRETQEMLFKIIDSLNENQRDIIILRYYFKLSYKKICNLMGVNKNTATSYMNYAKINIKKLINQKQQK